MPCLPAGTKAAREGALADLGQLIVRQRPDEGADTPAIADDLQLARSLIAGAMTKGSWSRNKAWATKFARYARAACPDLVKLRGVHAAFMADSVVLAFLARVTKDKPGTTTCVAAAKRAINFVRSLSGGPTLGKILGVRLLARAVRRSTARTVRQSPAFTIAFAQAVINTWGSCEVWWKRMVALMIAMALCIMARGAEVCSCLRQGLAWVRHDGTQVRSPSFVPNLIEDQSGAVVAGSVKGFLILLPSRKNRQSTPTWVPVISSTVMSMLARHIRWLDEIRGHADGCLFPARVSARKDGARIYVPSASRVTPMSVQSFRKLIRLALVECCGLSPQQASHFGTHSLRIGAMEILRSKGVPAELRQQLGGWISAVSALGYLQLPVTAQFNILGKIFH